MICSQENCAVECNLMNMMNHSWREGECRNGLSLSDKFHMLNRLNYLCLVVFCVVK